MKTVKTEKLQFINFQLTCKKVNYSENDSASGWVKTAGEAAQTDRGRTGLTSFSGRTAGHLFRGNETANHCERNRKIANREI